MNRSRLKCAPSGGATQTNLAATSKKSRAKPGLRKSAHQPDEHAARAGHNHSYHDDDNAGHSALGFQDGDFDVLNVGCK